MNHEPTGDERSSDTLEDALEVSNIADDIRDTLAELLVRRGVGRDLKARMESQREERVFRC